MSDWLDAADRLWPSIERQLPSPPTPRSGSRGRPRVPDHDVFLRLVLFLRAGCSWEVLDRLSAGSGVGGRTVRRRLAEWRRDGVFEHIWGEMAATLPTPAVGYLDASFLRARGGGEGVGLTRHGKGSRITVIADQRSWPIAVAVSSANPSERLTAELVLADPAVNLPATIVADRGYDTDALRDLVAFRGSTLVAPHRRGRVRPPRDQELLPTLYRERWRVERFFAWLAPWRWVATRWEKSLANYCSFVYLAIALIAAKHFWP